MGVEVDLETCHGMSILMLENPTTIADTTTLEAVALLPAGYLIVAPGV